MVPFLKTVSQTEFNLIFDDALNVDYSVFEYDTVFTSPPYYFIEKYNNNVKYATKKDMNELFYKPLFLITYKHLKPGGHYIINICKEVYDTVLIHLFGQPNEVFPLKKSKRQNNYTEMVYVWIKTKLHHPTLCEI
jgi:DNA modification methylase